MATSRYLTVNGKSLGFLSPRDEEIFDAGRWAALAELRVKVTALRDRPIATFDGYTGRDALDQVLTLIDGSRDA